MDAFFTDYLDALQALHNDFAAAFNQLSPEALDWLPGAEMNSLTVLVVHTTGATRFWISDVALGESSHRDRPAEFQARAWDEAALKTRLTDTEAFVRGALEKLTLAELGRVCDVPGRDFQRTVGYALLHALEHIGLHVGHAQLTRQLWDQRGS
jgi:uncharacterized damage-inducible protein DinB